MKGSTSPLIIDCVRRLRATAENYMKSCRNCFYLDCDLCNVSRLYISVELRVSYLERDTPSFQSASRTAAIAKKLRGSSFVNQAANLG